MSGVYPRYERAADIDRLVNAHMANRPGDDERYRHDMQFHLQTNVLRDALKRADRAMEFEGVTWQVRDRVLHRVVFCEAPEDTTDRLDYSGRLHEETRVPLGRLADLPPDVRKLFLNVPGLSDPAGNDDVQTGG